MMQYLPLIAACIALAIPPAQARPVSYPGGWTTMLQNNGDKNSVHVHYSPTAKTSIGFKGEHWRDGDYEIGALQMNNLLKRWNRRDSQANLYLKSGIGVADHKGDVDPALFTGVATDWENRRCFISYANRYTKADNIDDFFMQSARIGIAPYIGDYGDLHTWLMLEAEHTPEGKHSTTVTPLVRFFKDVHLVEVGMSNHGTALFNWVIRY